MHNSGKGNHPCSWCRAAGQGVAGVFGTIFNYGTILVQTEAGDLTLSTINKPETVYNELENAAHAAGRGIYED